MSKSEVELRDEIAQVMKSMDERQLNRGTSGNVSARFGSGMLVTPSGIPPAHLRAEQIVFVEGDGSWDSGASRPSSEWQMHLSILQRRADVNAVVHCHSQYATILACAHKEIPSLHYMVAVSGDSHVPVAPYQSFGTLELSAVTLDVLADRNAVLMANHGQVAVGTTLARALAIAEEIENQAAVYWGTLMIGGPKLLPESEMQFILDRFRGAYGQKASR